MFKVTACGRSDLLDFSLRGEPLSIVAGHHHIRVLQLPPFCPRWNYVRRNWNNTHQQNKTILTNRRLLKTLQFIERKLQSMTSFNNQFQTDCKAAKLVGRRLQSWLCLELLQVWSFAEIWIHGIEYLLEGQTCGFLFRLRSPTIETSSSVYYLDHIFTIAHHNRK